jgi:hypothetical protein
VGLNLLLSVSIASGPDLSSDGRMMMLSRRYSNLSSNGLCDMTGAHCYYDRTLLLVT